MDEQTKFLLKKDFIITSWQNLQVCVGINQCLEYTGRAARLGCSRVRSGGYSTVFTHVHVVKGYIDTDNKNMWRWVLWSCRKSYSISFNDLL